MAEGSRLCEYANWPGGRVARLIRDGCVATPSSPSKRANFG